jgi:hypothetical protein
VEPAREAARNDAARAQAQAQQHREAAAEAQAHPQQAHQQPVKPATPPEARRDEGHGEHKPHRKDEEHRDSRAEEAR